MKSLSTIVLFFLCYWFLTECMNYVIGFCIAIRQRIHKRIIRKQKRWANRIVKNY